MNSIPVANLLQDIFKYAAWPCFGSVAFIIIVIFFLVYFNKGISTLLSRTRKIGREGMEMSPESQKVKEKDPSAEELMSVFDSRVRLEQEKLIKKDLESYGLLDQNEVVDVLVRHLAATQLELYFEKVNATIWGSQISILKRLNSTPQGLAVESLELSYDIVAKLHPNVFTHYSFKQYLNFLLSWNLIIEQDNLYRITFLGKDFLSYLVRTGQPETRDY